MKNISLAVKLSGALFVGLLFFCPSIAKALEAQINVDEPSWYTDTGVGNQCDPENDVCYYPNLGLTKVRGYAPFAVMFKAASSTPSSTIVQWSWDFGAGSESDIEGRTFAGMNAAHVFETPGTYTVSLTVSDHTGATSTTSTSVTVLAPNGTTYYVDNVLGNDACDGTTSTVVSGTICPWKTADKAFSKIQRPSQWAPYSEWFYKIGDRILFKRGQTFNCTTTLEIGYGYGTQGYTFGAYGNALDPKPIIQYYRSDSVFPLTVNIGFAFVTFMDLRFDLLGGGGQGEGFLLMNAGIKNVLFLRDDFYEPHNGAISVNNDPNPTNMSSNIFIVSSTFQNPTMNTSSITQIFGFGVHNYVLLDNYFDKSGNHISYNASLHGALIYGNTFNRPAFGRTALRILNGDNIYIAANNFLGWIDPVNCETQINGCVGPHGVPSHNGGGTSYNWELIDISPGGNDGPFTLTNIIFEKNVISNFRTGLQVTNAHDMAIRNNLFVSPSNWVMSFLNLSDSWGSLGLTRPLHNVRVVGNTFVSNGATDDDTGAMLRVYPWMVSSTAWGNNHSQINISNNLFYGVGGSLNRAVVFASTSNDLISKVAMNNNRYFVPGIATSFASGTTYYSFSDWKIATGLDANSTSTDPVFSETVSSVVYAPGEPSAANNVAYANAYKTSLKLSDGSPKNDGMVNNVDSYYDMAGTVRYTNDNHVDIGAFEYTTSSPVISIFTTNSSTITTGNSATLSWSTSNATAISINQGVGVVTGLTQIIVSPTVSTTYTLTASNAFGSATSSVSVVVVAAPVVSSFTANSTTIAFGSSTILSWTTSGAVSLSIDQGVGVVTGFNTTTISPTVTTTYTLSATNLVGTIATSSVTVYVSTSTPVAPPVPVTPSGGGGGGGGGGGYSVPTNPFVSILNGAAATPTTSVSLNISASGASLMLVSNNEYFIGSSWQNYATNIPWVLSSSTSTTLTVYAKFRSSGGGDSAVATDTIRFDPESPLVVVTTTVNMSSSCPALKTGDMVKVTGRAAIYVIDSALNVKFFPDGDVFKSWNADNKYGGYVLIGQSCFDSLRVPTSAPFGVNYRPGSYVVKRASSDQLYVVTPNNTVATISSKNAKALYGSYKPKIIADVFWPNYVNRTSEVTSTLAHPGMLVQFSQKRYLVGVDNKLREITNSGFAANRFRKEYVRPIYSSDVLLDRLNPSITSFVSGLSDRTQTVDGDWDGLSSEEEITVWHTDPSKYDTDNDGYSDGIEVTNGYNPNKGQ